MAKDSEAVDQAARPVSELTKAEARKLTEQIRATLEKAWPLVLEAYERKAWAVLGYASFKQYIETELNISRGEGYRLVDQGKLIRELEKATGTKVEVSVREAAALRHDVPGTVAAVKDAVRGKRSGREDAAKEVVANRAAEAIEAKATERLTRDERPSDQGVQGQTSRARDAEPKVVERIAQAFAADLETAIDAVLDSKPVDARSLPASKLRDLAGWVKQAQAVHPAERTVVGLRPEKCSHKDATGRETVNKLPYAVVCTQCGTKVR